MSCRRLYAALRGLAAAVALCGLLAACSAAGGEEVAWRFRTLDEAGWESGDTLVFTTDSLPRAGRYATQVMVRTSAARPCPFTAVAFGVRRSWSGPGAPPPRVDTVWVELTTPRGDVTGPGVSIYQYAVTLDTLDLPAGCRGTVALEHLMRCFTLPGLRDAGVRVVEL